MTEDTGATIKRAARTTPTFAAVKAQFLHVPEPFDALVCCDCCDQWRPAHGNTNVPVQGGDFFAACAWCAAHCRTHPTT